MPLKKPIRDKDVARAKEILSSERLLDAANSLAQQGALVTAARLFRELGLYESAADALREEIRILRKNGSMTEANHLEVEANKLLKKAREQKN